MMLAQALGTGEACFLVLAIGMALAFEFVNGFHDTANAVATVIYTHSLPPWVAVIWSGLWNLIGVLSPLTSGGVAFSILALLPTQLVVDVGSSSGFAMVFAVLISAMLWNIGTWYLGLPASSSHALIGSLLGVGLAYAWSQKTGSLADGVNWAKAGEVALALVVSPIVGFAFSAGLVLLAKHVLKAKALFVAPARGEPPPWGIRGLLILTCTGVSYGHGSNDGQKGMGLLLLILVGILPGTYALRPGVSADAMRKLEGASRSAQVVFERRAGPAGVTGSAESGRDALQQYVRGGVEPSPATFGALAAVNADISASIAGRPNFEALDEPKRKALRSEIYLASATLGKLDAKGQFSPEERSALTAGEGGYRAQLDATTKFIPTWVKVAVAVALGLGTMIGWKRIVVTVGEKIGKEHLTYGQGAAAEVVAAATIIAADLYKMPVSTTHVLSSGVAGAMAANKSGVQVATLRNLLLAWVLTLPCCMMLGAATFAGGVYVVLNNLVPVAIAVGGVAAALLGIRFARTRMRKVRVAERSEAPAAPAGSPR